MVVSEASEICVNPFMMGKKDSSFVQSWNIDVPCLAKYANYITEQKIYTVL